MKKIFVSDAYETIAGTKTLSTSTSEPNDHSVAMVLGLELQFVGGKFVGDNGCHMNVMAVSRTLNGKILMKILNMFKQRIRIYGWLA